MNKSLFSSSKVEWETPQEFFEQLDAEFQFRLAPCSTHDNAKCQKHYTLAENGLIQDWGGESVFCNPPYGRQMPKWIEKCAKESTKPNTIVVMLIPARTDSHAFHEYIYHNAEIRFVRGRLKFGGSKNNAPFPSIVVVFNKKSEDKKW